MKARKRAKIFAFAIIAIFLLILGVCSYFSPASLRWTHRARFDPGDATPGIPVAETWEIAAIQGRIRWMHATWLTTPHVPANGLTGALRKNGLSLSFRNKFTFPLDENDLDWHFAGFGFGYPTFFRQGGAVDTGMDGLWQINTNELCVPVWLLVLLAVIPLLRFSWLQRQHPGETRCAGCGYDLRATPERCPECGLTAKKLPIEK